MLAVRELELDLDAFEGPFDLLLSLVLREELPLREVDLAEIIIAFIENLAERGELDLDACGEFLILISALLELKARAMFPDEDAELAELEPEEAAEELARRLAEYRRAKEAANWLRGAPRRAARPLLPHRPGAARAEARAQARPAGSRSSSSPHCAGSPSSRRRRRRPTWRFASRPSPSSSTAGASLLRRRSRFDFDQEVEGLSRVEVAVAFLALLELRKQDEIAIAQAGPFAPIRISRADAERSLSWTAHSA